MVRLRILDITLSLGIWVSGAFAACLIDTSFLWQVDDSVSAADLTTAVENCPGESFQVEWIGNVSIDRTVKVQNNTALNITGVGSEAVIDGGRKNRLFSVNNASLHVRNMHLSNGNASWGAGGAVAADQSALVFNQTTFVNNVAAEGGAIYAVGGSTVVWEVSSWFESNTAGGGGGGAVVASGADLTWSGSATFVNNRCENITCAGGTETSSVTTATSDNRCEDTTCTGGAVLVKDEANAVFEEQAVFSNNYALTLGGALMAKSGARISFAAEAQILQNHADLFGGGVCLTTGSTLFWAAGVVFFGNTAGINGGAIHVADGSSATWAAAANFTNNTAGSYGGAVSVARGSNASWQADALFAENTAGVNGGAVLVANTSSLSWAAVSSFVGNSAVQNGGALFTGYSSTVVWSGQTEFRFNYAGYSGGAIGSVVAYETEDATSLTFNGTTVFANNTCDESGGAIMVGGSLSPVTFRTSGVVFANNSAGNSGGALFITGVGVGIQFVGATFLSNYAEVGGAVYSTGSGLTVTKASHGGQVDHPTTFSDCEFKRNQAGATGGAVESAAGLDVISNTTFIGNTARIGGALRLAGTAYLENCSFIENSSAEEGPAASNIGYLEGISGNSFLDNVYCCDEGYYLHFNTSDGLFQTVCDGCGTLCPRCTFAGGIPECKVVLDHTSSPGGRTTIDELLVDSEYWRATTTSEDILLCYNPDACLGGVTGAADYCDEGYEGPYCSVCEEGYTKSLGCFTCTKCDGFGAGEIALAIVISVLVLPALISLVLYLVSVEFEGAGGRFVALVTRRVPVQSVKIVIVAWQILTQFATVANIVYPGVYDDFLSVLDVANFDLSWLMHTGCVFGLDFHDRLLIVTIGPIACVAVLGVTYSIATARMRSSDDAFLGKTRRKHLSAVILLTFLVYSSVSSVVFQMFACDELDDDKRYLRADYRIECGSSKHQALQVYAGFMVLLYPAGIPVFYAALLFKNRHVLMTGKEDRDQDERMRSTSALWQPYKPGAFFYEVVECGRRILLTGAVVFIHPSNTDQIAVSLLIAVLFVFVSEILAPYESQWDTWVSRAGHAIVFTSLYLAMLLEMDASYESSKNQSLFEAALVAAHVCMVMAVLAEAVVISWSLRVQEAGDDLARTQPCVDLSFLIQARETKSDNSDKLSKPDFVLDLVRVPCRRNVFDAPLPAYTVDCEEA